MLPPVSVRCLGWTKEYEAFLLRETQVTLLGLVAVLLLVFNLPESTARGTKSAVRELLVPYHSALASLGVWRSNRNPPISAPENDSSRTVALQRLAALEKENDELRRLLGYSRRLPNQAIACEVVARDGESGWWRTIRLNRGSRDGIETNDVAVTEAGLLGRVHEVSPHTADVLLISDPGCRIAVRCVRTGDFGLMEGGGVASRDGVMDMFLPAEPGEMTFISRESGIREGDEIVTSGLGGVFPQGFLVGRVARVQPARSGLYLNARIASAANLARLRQVLVITHKRSAVMAVGGGL